MVKNPEGKYNPEAVGNFNSDELGTMSLEDLVRLGIIPEINVPSVSKSRSVVSSNFNTSSNVNSSVNESDTTQSSSLTDSASFSKEKSSTPTLNEQKRIEISSYHNIHNVTSDSLPQKLSVHKSHSNSQFGQQNSTSSQANDANIKRTLDADETSTRGARIEDALNTERNNSNFSDGNNFERQSSVDSISSNRSRGIQDSSNVSHLPHDFSNVSHLPHDSTTNFETSQNYSHENPTSKSNTENSNVFLALKTSEDPSFYLTPSSLLLEPSIVGDLPRSNSARSSQDSLDETRIIGELKRAFYLY